MLNDFSDESQVAAINYEFYKLVGAEEAGKKPLEIYSKLYEKFRDTNSGNDYKKIIEEISS